MEFECLSWFLFYETSSREPYITAYVWTAADAGNARLTWHVLHEAMVGLIRSKYLQVRLRFFRFRNWRLKTRNDLLKPWLKNVQAKWRIRKVKEWKASKIEMAKMLDQDTVIKNW